MNNLHLRQDSSDFLDRFCYQLPPTCVSFHLAMVSLTLLTSNWLIFNAKDKIPSLSQAIPKDPYVLFRFLDSSMIRSCDKEMKMVRSLYFTGTQDEKQKSDMDRALTKND